MTWFRRDYRLLSMPALAKAANRKREAPPFPDQAAPFFPALPNGQKKATDRGPL